MLKLKDHPSNYKSENNKLPSRFGFGDDVIIYFWDSGYVKNCKVIKIHFTEEKVLYDVEVSEVLPDHSISKDRLYNLDSAIVFHPDDFETTELQTHANFTVRLKAYVEKKMKESGMLAKIQSVMDYDEREDMFRAFQDSIGDGAIEALRVEGCVKKYIPKQNA